MAIIKLTNNNVEYTGIRLHPEIYYSSSSLGENVTGSMYVSPFRSDTLIKKSATRNIKNRFSDDQIESSLANVYTSDQIEAELNSINSLFGAKQGIDTNNRQIFITKIEQPNEFTTGSMMKNYIKKSLMPTNFHRFQNSNFSYSNYNSLNCFTNNFIPTGSAFLYSNNKFYDLTTEEFSLNFWVNPRYTTSGSNFDAGTIFHMSSSICVSLVTGSNRNENNEIDRFKILLQLSHSANTPPSDINLAPAAVNDDTRIYPNNLVFTSSHSLKKDHWHHVCIQWGPDFNNQTGSIFIDNNETNFYIPSSSIRSPFPIQGLVVGNYFDSSTANLSLLLNSTESETEGYTPKPGTSVFEDDIPPDMFRHPLKAEIHELKLFNFALSEDVIYNNKTERQFVREEGIQSKNRITPVSRVSNSRECLFYLGPYFYPESLSREVLFSPYYNTTKITTNPFNSEFSHRVGGKIINLENFVVDLANECFPRIIGMRVGRLSTDRRDDIQSEDFIYSSGSFVKRNLSILPCDNGLFKPNFSYYNNLTYTSDHNRFKTPTYPVTSSNNDYSIISLENQEDRSVVINNNVIVTEIVPGSSFENLAREIFFGQLGPTPESTSAGQSGALISQGLEVEREFRTDLMYLAQVTRDVSSREVTIFNISNIYYGDRIDPNSFEIFDNNLTGSRGDIKIKLKDNGVGSLYRADAKTKHATWNNVGNIFYEEGLVLIKSPHLSPYCRDKFEMSFKGEQNIHTMILNIPAHKRLFNSSSNPTFEKITPSDNANDEDLHSIYVTTVNIHDNNFNIIMKANFSQPIVKTKDDEFVVRLKEDF